MKILALICRILLGLMFVVFGANGIHPFIPMKMPDLPADVATWDSVMMHSGWMTIVAALEVLGGLLVLIGGTLPAGLCLLCPISFNAILFHLCLMHGSGVAPAAFTAMLELVLIWAYRANFNGILTTKAIPLPRPS